jgi:hypothetical protein
VQGHDEGCKVVGQTNTTNRHAELASIGIIPVTKGAQSGEKYPFVVFSAPPSGSEDYVAEVRFGKFLLWFRSWQHLEFNAHDLNLHKPLIEVYPGVFTGSLNCNEGMWA